MDNRIKYYCWNCDSFLYKRKNEPKQLILLCYLCETELYRIKQNQKGYKKLISNIKTINATKQCFFVGFCL